MTDADVRAAGSPACLVCRSAETEGVFRSPVSVTSDGKGRDREVVNTLCTRCGHLFNASLSASGLAEFYLDEYDLHSESAYSEFQYLIDDRRVGANDLWLDFLLASAGLGEQGRLLEIGAGKGTFIQRFRARRPGWAVSAIEPSRNAMRYFRDLLPGVEVFEGHWEHSPLLDGRHDLVVAIGVLEHLPDPRAFLRRVRAALSDDGLLYLSVPNFLQNPADLFTLDHVSRFDPRTLEAVLAADGFEIVAQDAPATRVSMVALARPAPARGAAVAETLGTMRATVGRAIPFVESVFASYAAAMAAAQGPDVAVYGLGTLATVALQAGVLERAKLWGFVDDNSHMWGQRRDGLLVHSLDELKAATDVREVVFSANPCYLEAMRRRLGGLAVECRLPASVAAA